MSLQTGDPVRYGLSRDPAAQTAEKWAVKGPCIPSFHCIHCKKHRWGGGDKSTDEGPNQNVGHLNISP